MRVRAVAAHVRADADAMNSYITSRGLRPALTHRSCRARLVLGADGTDRRRMGSAVEPQVASRRGGLVRSADEAIGRAAARERTALLRTRARSCSRNRGAAKARVLFPVRAQAVSAARVDTAPVRLPVPPRRSAPMPHCTPPAGARPRLLPLPHPRAYGSMDGSASASPRKGLLRVRATATAAVARRCSSRCTWRAARWMRRASSTQPAATCSCS